MDPEFVMTFVVTKEEEAGRERYGDFIGAVRRKVTESCIPVTGVVQHVLPPEEEGIPRLFHIVLKTKTSSLTLAVRMDNLDLIGFKTPDPDGMWWEFGQEGHTHLINDSRWLGYGGSYKDLHPRRALRTIALGREQMEYAVDSLAKYPAVLMVDNKADDPRRTLKQMLARLAIMLCEGLRFLTVYHMVDELFHVQRSTTISETEEKQVKYWDKISKAVLTWAANPGAKFPRLVEVGIKNKDDAARIIALVKEKKEEKKRMDPKFVMTFVVTKEEEAGRKRYGDFIGAVRRKVTESCTLVSGVVQHVLPREEEGIPKLFHIVLKTKTSSLTLAARMVNLDLVGFKTPGAGGVWWEFGQDGDTHLINDSKWLGYGGSYDELHPRRALHTIALGRLQMEYAVDSLAKYPQGLMVDDEAHDPRKTLKQMLARLAIMLCEGLRFPTVHRKVDELFDVQRSATINEIEGQQVKYWDMISKAVLSWAVDPAAEFPELVEVGIKDKDDAAGIIALVKRSN